MPSRHPDLRIEVTGVEPAEAAAVPTLRFPLRIANQEGPQVRSLTLATHIRIDAAARAYGRDEQARLVELFGAPEDWGRTLGSLLWARAVTQLPAFGRSADAAVEVTCTYDFEVAATKFFHGLDGGDVPLQFLFGGTVFYVDDGRLQAAPVRCEYDFRMPARAWKDLMDRYFPGSAWIRLSRDAFDRLHAYRARHTLVGWDDVVDALLRTGGG
ncbi:DUF6084 family protein [Nonomuraea pusilla]|uniref:DUF6084 family protein n=1 Tax=Nonomuraea pusilla TaxID=46177 RepID=UPI0033186F89